MKTEILWTLSRSGYVLGVDLTLAEAFRLIKPGATGYTMHGRRVAR